MKQQIFNLPFADYQAMGGINHSSICHIDRSPKHYRAELAKERKPSDAMALGTYFHVLVLEPEKANLFIVAPKIDKRTTEGKRTWAEFLSSLPADAVLISAEQQEKGKAMREAVMAHSSARRLIEKVRPENREVTITFKRGEMDCKARVDAIADGGLLLDLKTTQDASLSGFGKSAWNYNYPTQAEWYCYAMQSEQFAFIAVENEEPYDVVCYAVPVHVLSLAAKINEKRLATLTRCMKVNEWPGVSDVVQELELPGWALNKMESAEWS